MRALGGLALVAILAAGQAAAAPAAAPGFGVEVVEVPGAIFAGLADDGEALLVTNLADGRLYRRTADGAMTAFGPVLPHGLDVIGDPTGPYRVVRHGAAYLVAQGWTPIDDDEGPLDHALLEVSESGVLRVIDSDFWNPFDLAIDGDTLFVVDAGRNSVERLDPAGTRRTLFTFPRLKQAGAAMAGLSPTEFAKPVAYEVDAVPTGIALHEGRLFVSLFGGFPYVQDGGAVVSLDPAGPDAEVRLEADGLNAPVGVAFAVDGGLLVLEHGRFDQATGFVEGSGRLLRIDRSTGQRETLVSGLTRPASVTVRDGMHLVVSELGGALVLVDKTAGR